MIIEIDTDKLPNRLLMVLDEAIGKERFNLSSDIRDAGAWDKDSGNYNSSAFVEMRAWYKASRELQKQFYKAWNPHYST
jgi:hypothetical protein